MTRKPLRFNAFVMNTNSHIHHGQWQRPEAQQTEFTDVNTWINVARLLEDAKFDAMFFADVVGHYGDADSSYEEYVKQGLQIPSNDPTVLLGALAVVTEHIGLATTSNVFQSHPFQFARQMATLDHMSNGRIAWNIVTGTQDNGARNFGLPQLTDHAERYAWADEYVDVLYKLLEGSWDDDAILKDREGFRYSDYSKVHKIYHEGQRYQVEGPLLSAPSPQRTPVLYQAGSSASGRDFAARNAEATFIIAPSIRTAEGLIKGTRERAVRHGRDAHDIAFFQGMSFVIGSTEEEARAKEKIIDENVSLEGYAAHAAVVDRDGRVYPPETPLSEVETNTVRGFLELAKKEITDREPLVADLAWNRAKANRVVGTPEQIADELERWQDIGVDGINVMNWVIPDSFQDFADHVMPVLRDRGLAQSEYAPGTLRKKLFGHDRLPDTHPPAKYRGAFANSERDPQGQLTGASI